MNLTDIRADQREAQWLASDYAAAAFYATVDPITVLSEWPGNPYGPPHKVRDVLHRAQRARDAHNRIHGHGPANPRKRTA